MHPGNIARSVGDWSPFAAADGKEPGIDCCLPLEVSILRVPVMVMLITTQH